MITLYQNHYIRVQLSLRNRFDDSFHASRNDYTRTLISTPSKLQIRQNTFYTNVSVLYYSNKVFSRYVVVFPWWTWWSRIWRFASSSWGEKPRSWLTSSSFGRVDHRSLKHYRRQRWGKEPSSFGIWWWPWYHWPYQPYRLDEST